MDMHYTPALHAQEPSISYVKTPANFTSHYIKAASFTGKQCEVRWLSPRVPQCRTQALSLHIPWPLPPVPGTCLSSLGVSTT